jgi:hypothetical protein
MPLPQRVAATPRRRTWARRPRRAKKTGARFGLTAGSGDEASPTPAATGGVAATRSATSLFNDIVPVKTKPRFGVIRLDPLLTTTRGFASTPRCVSLIRVPKTGFKYELPRTRHHRRPRQILRRRGARPPRASPAAPRSRQIARDAGNRIRNGFVRSGFSARARKTAPVAGALPFPPVHAGGLRQRPTASSRTCNVSGRDANWTAVPSRGSARDG